MHMHTSPYLLLLLCVTAPFPLLLQILNISHSTHMHTSPYLQQLLLRTTACCGKVLLLQSDTPFTHTHTHTQAPTCSAAAAAAAAAAAHHHLLQ
jgi:hypothetical protein